MRLRQSRLLRFAPLGVALVMAGASAHAQNVISRQVTEEPVETMVTQTPTGTVITRRPLAASPLAPAFAPVPAWTPAAPAVAVEPAFVPARESVQVRRFETSRPAPAARATRATYAAETVGAAPAARTVAARRLSAPQRVSRTTRSAQRSATIQRTTTVRRIAAGPLVLDPAQRRIVYRTIVQQQVVPAAPVYPARPAIIPATTGYGYAVPPDVDDDDVYVAREVVPSAF